MDPAKSKSLSLTIRTIRILLITVTTGVGICLGLEKDVSPCSAPCNKLVRRAGRPGPPMMLGTHIMEDEQNQIVKSLGFTLAQSDSDHLSVNETKPNQWEWSRADKGLASSRKAGFKWQYFPHFHWPPEWYRDGEKFVPSVALHQAGS